MLFPTIEFAVFFAVVFAVSWALNRYNTTKKSFLVLASYFFYAFWKLAYVLVLFLSSTANYGLALLLGRMADGPLRRAVFWLGVIGNLAVLGVFKYYDFFVAATPPTAPSSPPPRGSTSCSTSRSFPISSPARSCARAIFWRRPCTSRARPTSGSARACC